MRRLNYCLLALALGSGSALAGGMGMSAGDPLIGMLTLDKLEWQRSDAGSLMHWNLVGWVGYDLNKLRLQSEGHRLDGETEESSLQLHYQRAIDPWWDLLIGWRGDTQPEPTRDWASIGVVGTAPWMIHTQANLYLRSGGHQALRIDAETEYLLTQQLQLSPSLEANLYSQDDPGLGRGKGLSDLSIGLRLGYSLRREFTPYVGYSWSGLYGSSADHARSMAEPTSEGVWLAGINAWF